MKICSSVPLKACEPADVFFGALEHPVGRMVAASNSRSVGIVRVLFMHPLRAFGALRQANFIERSRSGFEMQPSKIDACSWAPYNPRGWPNAGERSREPYVQEQDRRDRL